MNLKRKVPLVDLNVLTKITNDFLLHGENFGFGKHCDLKEIEKSVFDLKFDLDQRLALVESLQKQYLRCGMNTPKGVLKLKSKDAYTITTGHQLCLFGGPLFVLYKIASTISLARKLNKQNPLFQFIPVFWMATEDHDFEEVSSLNVAGKIIRWESGQSGCVGRMSVDGLENSFSALKEALGSRIDPFKDIIDEALLQKNVSDFYRVFIHGIFGTDELVIIDPDDRNLKTSFTDIALNDLEGCSQRLLAETNVSLVKSGYRTQVKGRPINLFWIDSGSRSRIVQQDADFIILGTDRKYSKEQFKQLISDYPEKLSPNVVLRPVYQQKILPNLITIGGGGELAYWLQLKEVFKEFDVFYPMLQMRSSYTLLGDKWIDKWMNMGFDFHSLFLPSAQLKNEFVANDNAIDIMPEIVKIQKVFDDIIVKVVQFEKNFDRLAGAEKRKLDKQLEDLNKRLLKVLKANNEDGLKRIDRILEMVKPQGVLQERYNSMYDYFPDTAAVKELVNSNNPTDNAMRFCSISDR